MIRINAFPIHKNIYLRQHKELLVKSAFTCDDRHIYEKRNGARSWKFISLLLTFSTMVISHVHNFFVIIFIMLLFCLLVHSFIHSFCSFCSLSDNTTMPEVLANDGAIAVATSDEPDFSIFENKSGLAEDLKFLASIPEVKLQTSTH